MSTIDRVREIADPLLRDRGFELYDVEQRGPVVRVTVEDADGVDLDELAGVSRTLSLALDEQDPIPGRYTLEVSSPGLERPLRTPRHFEQAIGSEVTVKTRVDIDGNRRFTGVLVEADDSAMVMQVDGDPERRQRLLLADIDKARTVFDWSPAPKPGSSSSRAKGAKTAKLPTTRGKAAST